MIYERMLSEHNRLENQICSIQNELKKLPPGKLICSHTENRCKWYHSDGHQKTYIPKNQQQLAEKLAIKKYLSLSLEDMEHEKKAIQFYLNHHNPSGKAELLLTQPSGYQNLLTTYFSPLSQELTDWQNASYEHCPLHPERLTLTGASGNLVRSKSEVIIDMSLHIHKIPFRYECVLHLGASTLYPDFTIRHPATGETYYWEHFGMMDDPDYSRNACSKLQLYTTHGIIPSINLITTYETKHHPLSVEMIEGIIQYYFL